MQPDLDRETEDVDERLTVQKKRQADRDLRAKLKIGDMHLTVKSSGLTAAGYKGQREGGLQQTW